MTAGCAVGFMNTLVKFYGLAIEFFDNSPQQTMIYNKIDGFEVYTYFFRSLISLGCAAHT